MTDIGSSERQTQNRVIALFRDRLGYEYLGDWSDRLGNTSVETTLLEAWLKKQGAFPAQISNAVKQLCDVARHPGTDLYAKNEAVYELLRYPVKVKTDAGDFTHDVRLIDWDRPEKNHFAIAQEVTLKEGATRRPDLVLYVNGIAVGVIELKSSVVGLGEGIAQLLSNQQDTFNAGFFAAAQFVFAGNDSEGLMYGTTLTPAKFFLRWKEDAGAFADLNRLDRHLAQMCGKDRLIELMRDFVLFDGGVKKVPRVHQYFGIKRSQEHVARREGGILWHTQGSGKSIVMVLLARWILRTNPNARVLIITDRDELDGQIDGVFAKGGEAIHRATSARDLLDQLGRPQPRLLCSLVHKFGQRDADGKSPANFDAMIKELAAAPSPAVGELFVFVDECHRTQSGKLHRVMKTLLPGAVFMGFTGTPLLKQDKKTSREVFGGYIHTYKFGEAVEDEVVLDLVYDPRDIDQRLGNPKKIDDWFAAQTQGLSESQRDQLKAHWGTMQKVLSSKSRIDRIVSDIVLDFATKPILKRERGNAILVASSIYEACKYFEQFQNTAFHDRCAIVTSYDPKIGDVSKEEMGASNVTDKQYIYRVYDKLLKDVDAAPKMSKAQTYEHRAKHLFVKEPARMKLLVVVDKLLTGFDAPSCSYLYIDKSMRDHGLFQAICRTNRLDGAEKTVGNIVDYKDLFKAVEKTIAVYTAELDLDDADDGVSCEILMQSRLEKGRTQLDEALEAAELNCQPVPPPRDNDAFIAYFCGDPEKPDDLKQHEPRRVAMYAAVAALARAFANLADELGDAGYGDDDADRLKERVRWFVKARDTVRLAAREVLDVKPFEADMRFLIDNYISADDPRSISPFGERPLLELIVKSGIADAIAQQLKNRGLSQNAVAETIENNVRSTITERQSADPAFFARMSSLLGELIANRRAKAIEYANYLEQIEELVRRVEVGQAPDTPDRINTPGKLALFNNLNQNAQLAEAVHDAVLEVRQDGFRGNKVKENKIKREALLPLLGSEEEVERVFGILYQHSEY